MGTIYVCMELPQMLERLQHYHPNADTDLVSPNPLSMFLPAAKSTPIHTTTKRG